MFFFQILIRVDPPAPQPVLPSPPYGVILSLPYAELFRLYQLLKVFFNCDHNQVCFRVWWSQSNVSITVVFNDK